jgi:hypothetical protein
VSGSTDTRLVLALSSNAAELVLIALVAGAVILGIAAHIAIGEDLTPPGTPDYMPIGMGAWGGAYAKDSPGRAIIWVVGQLVAAVALTLWAALSDRGIALVVIVAGVAAFEVYEVLRCVPRALRAMREHSASP